MSAPRLVFLHGFTQSHHLWHGPASAIDAALGGGHELAFVDLPGHGLAADDPADRSLDDAAPALARLGGPGTWIGYSMGARFALRAALEPDSHIERLVLIGGTAGIVDPDERAARQALDATRAARLAEIGVARFVDEWLAMPMFARLPVDAAGTRQRLRNTQAGLAASLRTAGVGSATPLWDRLGEITFPVLVVAGAHDGKFVAIGTRLAAALPHAQFATIPDAGHAAHSEQPAAVAAAIATWLVAVDGAARSHAGDDPTA